MLRTPILFIVFNRLDTAQQVFDRIKEVQPSTLYVACDGPRLSFPNEIIACEQTKKLVAQIDWECNLKTMFLTENLGPSKAPYTFIKWFFSHEEQGIVLEHDCLPHSDFFAYCEDLLEKYKYDLSIGAISGSNFVPIPNDSNSYTFTVYNHIWGWATWRRTISQYTLDLSVFPKKEVELMIKRNFSTYVEQVYWRTIYWQICNGYIPTWDYYLTFCLWMNNFLSISPNINLVSNIGFGEKAVNTTNINSPLAKMQTGNILPLVYNNNKVINKTQELAYFKRVILEDHGAFQLYVKLFLKRIGVFNYLMRIKKHRKISLKK